MFGKDKQKKELIARLPQIFADLQREHQISPGDFPDVTRMQELLVHHVRGVDLLRNVLLVGVVLLCRGVEGVRLVSRGK